MTSSVAIPVAMELAARGHPKKKRALSVSHEEIVKISEKKTRKRSGE